MSRISPALIQIPRKTNSQEKLMDTETSKTYYKVVYGIIVKITVEYDATTLNDGREMIVGVDADYDKDDYRDLSSAKKALFDSEVYSLMEFYGH